MNIYDYYLNRNKDKNYVEKFQSTSDENYGKTFQYINTNYRTILAFVNTFPKFFNNNDKPREEWEIYPNGEQKAKHWTVRMEQAKLFSKGENKYSVTAKGNAFLDLIVDINKYSKDEQWILVYYFLLNAYFDFQKNYIIYKSKIIYSEIENIIKNVSYINNIFLDFLKNNEDIKFNELIEFDAFWILSFYKDINFINLFYNAENTDKEKLINHIKVEKSKKNFNDLLVYKYKSDGQYSVSMFIDDMKVLYVTNELLKKEDNLNSIKVAENIINIYNTFRNVNVDNILNFVNDHIDVFDVIFNETILNKDIDSEINNNNTDIEEEPETEKIDDTTVKNNNRIRKTSQILKNMAKDRSEYRCELESLNGCKYFTSKENQKNYLEIHHLVPFEFNNSFCSTLDVLENYVALCPHCHRLLHLGVDREREPDLRMLYNMRQEELKEKGIDIKIEEFLKFYGLKKNK